LLTGLFSKLYRPRCQWKGGWFRQFTRIPLNRCPHHQLVALFRCAPFPGFCLAFTSHSKVGTCEETQIGISGTVCKKFPFEDGLFSADDILADDSSNPVAPFLEIENVHVEKELDIFFPLYSLNLLLIFVVTLGTCVMLSLLRMLLNDLKNASAPFSFGILVRLIERPV